MPERFLEENRFLFLETGLGANELLLESFTGTEGISQLFSFQLELLSENPRIKFEGLLGQEVSFGVAGMDGQEKRYIHGIVTSFSQLPATLRFSRYRAEVSPKLWILTQKARSRVFQNLSVPDILRKVFDSIDVTFEIYGTHHPREFCVQYRESDFNFASRLMEEEGIYYFFKHSANGHKLVVADMPQSHIDLPGDPSLIYDELKGGERDEYRIFDWEKTQHWGSGKHSLREHCFEIPKNRLGAETVMRDAAQVGKVTHKLQVSGNDQFEIYDYPGGHAKIGSVSNMPSSGDSNAKIGMQQMEVSQFLIRGQSNVHGMVPGYRFTLERHFNADGQYVLTSIVHSATEGGFHSEGDTDEEGHYSNIFTCIPIALPYRPPRASAKPHVWGCQTAYVVGPGGEEIYTDKYGRVKVQFHWDREGKNDADSSCWVRVGSIWAGKAWGAIHIPRIGQEVIVDFLEGDPDRPIIVGSVYNADQMPPYSLPGNKTQSGIKSRSSKGGGGGNYNEIRFEDKMGSEEVLIHAEKDLLTEVEHNEKRTVGNDRSTTIGHDDTCKVSHDKSLTVANNRSAEIASNDSETVGSSQTVTIGSNQTTSVGSNASVTVGGSRTETVAMSETHTVGTSRSTSIGASESLLVGGPVSITAGGPVTIMAPSVIISAPIVQVAGVLQCMSLITTSVVSPVYTPGAGNLV